MRILVVVCVLAIKRVRGIKSAGAAGLSDLRSVTVNTGARFMSATSTAKVESLTLPLCCARGSVTISSVLWVRSSMGSR